jgi:hypothetical protein
VNEEFCRIINEKITETIHLVTNREMLSTDDKRAVQILMDILNLTSVEKLIEMQDYIKTRFPTLPNTNCPTDQS